MIQKLLILSIVYLHTYLYATNPSNPILLKKPYTSVIERQQRDYYLYLPKDYHTSQKNWPVLIFLNGDGERGNGKEDLGFVLKHGPLYEAWIQKRNLPFIIIAPQLNMLGRDGKGGSSYLKTRKHAHIPKRQAKGMPPREKPQPARKIAGEMKGNTPAKEVFFKPYVEKSGWHKTDPDVINILDKVTANYRVDSKRVYLTGLSMGGYGVWYYAAKYPKRFAAILPIVGYPKIAQAVAIAKANIPVWCFSGGRDTLVKTKYFFPGLNAFEKAGGKLRFTTEQDMHHDVWKRVYAGEDVYRWLLGHKQQN